MLSRAQRVAKNFGLGIANLGLLNTLHYVVQRSLIVPLRAPDLFSVRSKYARFPLYCRRGTSDKDVFGQIFIDREYRCLDPVRDANLIIDCGANCGFASAYFLSKYPSAKVIAIEPDPKNFVALQKNLQPYGGRVTAVQAGVWSRSLGLRFVHQLEGDGREWAIAVQECGADEKPDVMAVDIPSILKQADQARVSILKIDIEGSEKAVFAPGQTDWLDRVDNLVIELHGEDCEKAVVDAVLPRGFEMSRCDELTVFRRKPSGRISR